MRKNLSEEKISLPPPLPAVENHLLQGHNTAHDFSMMRERKKEREIEKERERERKRERERERI
jgi:hypothetical protein